ncbi:colicin V biosynthesis protein [Terrihabitans soli]|uniref:Colicin V biosynthesis protein n=1 Tax=Terrihabitans soli TaxID=708113 RepID=A0A6S6QV26_9HYPH|nr:CvpA family protein [Terrihabitans soli]BCJ90830.1 colicin V biosynthesis protein [Terrihabitans soli]
MPIALLDLIVLGIVLLSALLAMVRGFTREVLSIASWAAAAGATLYFLPDVRGWARAQLNLQPEILADVIAGAGIFLVTLLLVSLVTMRLSDFILDSRVGPFDRALGFLYGGARGFLLAVVAFLFFNWLVPERSQPSWVVDSASKPLLEGTGDSLLAMLPEDPEATILKQLKGGLPGSSDPTPAPDTDPANPAAPTGDASPPPEAAPTEPGYRPAEQQQMDRLTAPTTPN